MADSELLSPAWWRFVADARTAVLTTLGADGRPAPVPICHVVLEGTLYAPLDEKPKRSANPRSLARVRNLVDDPRAALLVHRWDEDWSQLAFVRMDVEGALIEPDEGGHATAVVALRAKYPQYVGHRLEDRPMLRFVPIRATTWGTPD
jgi:PPOX class probable F420-dependent enzyme